MCCIPSPHMLCYCYYVCFWLTFQKQQQQHIWGVPVHRQPLKQQKTNKQNETKQLTDQTTTQPTIPTTNQMHKIHICFCLFMWHLTELVFFSHTKRLPYLHSGPWHTADTGQTRQNSHSLCIPVRWTVSPGRACEKKSELWPWSWTKKTV